MSDRETLLANCLDAPADDTARLVYADFLREQDSSLGRFVWAGVTLSRFRGNEPVTDGMFFDAQKDLNETAFAVLRAQLAHLLGWEPKQMLWDTDADVCDRVTAVTFPPGPPPVPGVGTRRERAERRKRSPAAVYERGMLHTLRLPLVRWREVAAEVLASCPLERVEVLNVPGLTMFVRGPEDGWCLGGELKLPRRARLSSLTGSPPRTITWRCIQFAERAKFVELVVRETDDLVEAMRLDAGDRWPGPRTNDEGEE